MSYAYAVDTGFLATSGSTQHYRIPRLLGAVPLIPCVYRRLYLSQVLNQRHLTLCLI